jgi:hypothetical protein
MVYQVQCLVAVMTQGAGRSAIYMHSRSLRYESICFYCYYHCHHVFCHCFYIYKAVCNQTATTACTIAAQIYIAHSDLTTQVVKVQVYISTAMTLQVSLVCVHSGQVRTVSTTLTMSYCCSYYSVLVLHFN